MRYISGKEQRTSSTPHTTSRQEWLPESAHRVPGRDDRDATEQFATSDASALLTELQRTALRWLAFFD